jgi:hypothetical protein
MQLVVNRHRLQRDVVARHEDHWFLAHVGAEAKACAVGKGRCLHNLVKQHWRSCVAHNQGGPVVPHEATAELQVEYGSVGEVGRRTRFTSLCLRRSNPNQTGVNLS